MTKASASENWLATDGKMLESGYTITYHRRGRNAKVRVSYQYEVGDKSYTGDNLSFENPDHFSVGECRRLVAAVFKRSELHGLL